MRNITHLILILGRGLYILGVLPREHNLQENLYVFRWYLIHMTPALTLCKLIIFICVFYNDRGGDAGQAYLKISLLRMFLDMNGVRGSLIEI